jgi:hypothetical protein
MSTFSKGEIVWAPGHGPAEVTSFENMMVCGLKREYVTVETSKGAVVYDARALKPTDKPMPVECECCGGSGYRYPSPQA